VPPNYVQVATRLAIDLSRLKEEKDRVSCDANTFLLSLEGQIQKLQDLRTGVKRQVRRCDDNRLVGASRSTST